MTTKASKRAAFDTATVADAMHPGVITCPRQATLATVARMMAAYRVHCVVVFDEERDADDADALWGVISDLDLAGALAEGDADEQPAGSMAAGAVVTVAATESLRRAAQLMVEHATAHLVVVDPASALPVGVVSTLDLARVLAGGTLR